MVEYPLQEDILDINDQTEIFSIHSQTYPLTPKRRIIEYCETPCGEFLNNFHIYKSTKLNSNWHEHEINKILNRFRSKV